MNGFAALARPHPNTDMHSTRSGRTPASPLPRLGEEMRNRASIADKTGVVPPTSWQWLIPLSSLAVQQKGSSHISTSAAFLWGRRPPYRGPASQCLLSQDLSPVPQARGSFSTVLGHWQRKKCVGPVLGADSMDVNTEVISLESQPRTPPLWPVPLWAHLFDQDKPWRSYTYKYVY